MLTQEKINGILDIINEILEDKGEKNIKKIDLDASLRKDIGFDSIDLAVLTAKIDVKYGIDIFEDGIVDTVKEILEKLG